ncbi:MAG: 2,3-diphosphoglycerate-dependent phosphoglycerate mutase [Acidimicrobiia bacterium]|nr:2,3-diphosphoglycerate-dependent phosphoglycerate mutase [Acidimicrobiia bacterium]
MVTTHTLVLLRHGQSTWNLENIFTGWTDVPLSGAGEDEARTSGRLMAHAGIEFDVVHTSVLRRAIDTASLSLNEMGLGWIPVTRHWRLNERHYGDLQGLNKKETVAKHGQDQVHLWRRGYTTAPPPLDLTDDRHPAKDRRYRDLPPELLPSSECLADVVERMLPYWYDAIVPDLMDGKTVLVVAHGNSLRALVKHLDGISDEEIPSLNIPTGVPLRYDLDDDMRVVSSGYLGDQAEIAAAAEAVAKQAG